MISGCAQKADKPSAFALIEKNLAAHINYLASDELEGRRPGTEAEGKVLRYMSSHMRLSGLESGTNDPAHPWFAPVELALRLPSSTKAKFSAHGRTIVLEEEPMALFSTGQRFLIEAAPMVYIPPEHEHVDSSALTGKIAVIRGDQPARTLQRAALLDNGAAGVLIIMPSDKGYSDFVRTRAEGAYALAKQNAPSVLEGVLSHAAADKIFGAERLGRWLGQSDGTPQTIETLDTTATIEVISQPGTVRTHNLIAKLPGKDPSAGAILLLAHWDHFGNCGKNNEAKLEVCNGAVDNASGLAMLIELAKRLSDGPRYDRPKFDRDIYFLATTGEEWGLLGVQEFVRNPPMPLNTIVAAFNLDTMAVAPRGAPLGIVGEGLTGLDADVKMIAGKMGRSFGDTAFAQSFLRRQDGWILLQHDVPSLLISSSFGSKSTLMPFIGERYHTAADDITGVELGGAAQDLLLHEALVRHFASKRNFTR